jgi:deazaflavin-dependent oxidoreductase (nitroreductase family)
VIPADLAALPYCYLTTTGRITGVAHRIEIWFGSAGDTLYLLSGGRERSDWVRNLEVSPEVVVELGDTRRLLRARVVAPDTDEDALARRLLVEKYQPDSEDDLTSWGRTALPVAIEWSSR